MRIESHDELLARLDAELATLADRDAPLLLEVVVAPDETFDPDQAPRSARRAG